MHATAIIQLENERVVVTQWHFVPGAETSHHVHAHDYVVVPLTSGTLRLEDGADTKESRLEAGVSYANLAGTAHNVINANNYDFSFVEIELK
jgi:quercetin dioxygenase-like cupin family protein